MANYARVVNNIAVEVSTDPAFNFHPQLAEQFVPVPDEIESGWIKKGTKWSAPVVSEVTVVKLNPFLTPVQFKMCFTPAERVAINALKTTDHVLIAAYEILDDPRLTQVDLSLTSVQQMIDYIKSLDIIDEDRVLEIKAGIIK